MDLSGEHLVDERVVTVGLNSTVIAGPNAKRTRLTISPTSSTPVWVDSNGPAGVNAGRYCAAPNGDVVYGDGKTPGVFGNAVTGIANVAAVNVVVIDEFLG